MVYDRTRVNYISAKRKKKSMCKIKTFTSRLNNAKTICD